MLSLSICHGSLLRAVSELVTRAPRLPRPQGHRGHALPRLHTHEARPVLRPQVRHPPRPLLPGIPHHAVRQVCLAEAQPPARGAEPLDTETVGGVPVDPVSEGGQSDRLPLLLDSRGALQGLVNIGQTLQPLDRHFLHMRNSEQ